ncbi:MAG: D-alanyl-D-alanine carboxypeptidase family protein [gamma proteobacterium symbiont of Taylorina sp.]|nr:D-alanyl-D-alanine carboxypeptidase family protein [gamma proteobacterium symbiont of Taylorina sp.]
MLGYKKRIILIHHELGIPDSYENKYALKLQKEETKLVEIGNDIYGRLQRLIPLATSAWAEMKEHAQKEGVTLNIVSAFRAVDKQRNIIYMILGSGQTISEILKVCAAPGYSEHHTGRAVDFTSTECEPLSEEFENTEAFIWLNENAKIYSFRLSYPKNNLLGIAYEPWHWAYSQA